MHAPAVTAKQLEVERLGDGPPVLFVHGSVVGPRETWRKQRELAERWTLVLPSRPGFGASPELPGGGDFDLEAELFAELLEDGAHLVGHSYGAVIALLAAAKRPEAVRSLTISEPGSLAVAAGNPAVDEMRANGRRLYEAREKIPPELFLRFFRDGAHSARETPDELPPELRRGAELLLRERPPFDAEIPLSELAAGPFAILVISGGHSRAFDAVCDAVAAATGAARTEIRGRGHTIPSIGRVYNAILEEFFLKSERVK